MLSVPVPWPNIGLIRAVGLSVASVRPVVVDEIARQSRVQEARFGGVVGIVAGIKMGDTHDVAGGRRGVGRHDARARRLELRMGLVDEPQVGVADGIDVAVGRHRVAAAGNAERLAVGTGPQPALLQVGLGQHHVAAGDAQSLIDERVAGVPGIEVCLRFGDMPDGRGRHRRCHGAVDARHQRRERQVDRCAAERETSGRRSAIGLDQKPQSPLDHGPHLSSHATLPKVDKAYNRDTPCVAVLGHCGPALSPRPWAPACCSRSPDRGRRAARSRLRPGRAGGGRHRSSSLPPCRPNGPAPRDGERC